MGENFQNSNTYYRHSFHSCKVWWEWKREIILQKLLCEPKSKVDWLSGVLSGMYTGTNPASTARWTSSTLSCSSCKHVALLLETVTSRRSHKHVHTGSVNSCDMVTYYWRTDGLWVTALFWVDQPAENGETPTAGMPSASQKNNKSFRSYVNGPVKRFVSAWFKWKVCYERLRTESSYLTPMIAQPPDSTYSPDIAKG